MGSAVPIVFKGMVGWLHLPVKAHTGVGVVLVSTFGREASCAYAPMRILADDLAAVGFPTLQFSFRGVGDSLDDDDETADALPGWLSQIDDAMAELRERAKVTRTVLGGMRLGATLAALKAGSASGLMLFAPALKGRSWLNSARFSDELSSDLTVPPDQGGWQTGGFWFSSATVTSLGAIDLADVLVPAEPVFIATQNRQVAAFGRALAEGSVPVETVDFPEFRRLFPDPATSQTPREAFRQALDWMVRNFGGVSSSSVGRPDAPAQPAILQTTDATEEIVEFDGLWGVMCTPVRTAAGAPAVLFCNTGGDPRSGVGRFATLAARRLAREGVPSLRFDFAGLGDSPPRDPTEPQHVYETPRDRDMDAAIAFLARQGGDRVVCVGVCSGAYHALQASWRNRAIVGVCAINPIKIVWRRGDALTFGGGRYRRPVSYYFAALFAFDSWKSNLRLGFNPLSFLLVLWGRLIGRLTGWAGRRTAASPLTQMRRFLSRGGRAYFVTSVRDASLEELETHFGPGCRLLSSFDAVNVEVVPELDHSLSQRSSRELALDRLVRWVVAGTADLPPEPAQPAVARRLPEAAPPGAPRADVASSRR